MGKSYPVLLFVVAFSIYLFFFSLFYLFNFNISGVLYIFYNMFFVFVSVFFFSSFFLTCLLSPTPTVVLTVAFSNVSSPHAPPQLLLTITHNPIRFLSFVFSLFFSGFLLCFFFNISPEPIQDFSTVHGF